MSNKSDHNSLRSDALRRLVSKRLVSDASVSLAILIALAVFSVALPSELVQASAGDRDLTFGHDGKVITDFSGNEAAADVKVQPDGKIVAAGITTIDTVNSDFALARYNPDGSLDSGFGAGGRVTTDFAGMFDRANALALQPDGKIIVAGLSGDRVSTGDFALARYNVDGTLDPDFGVGGKLVTDFFGGFDSASEMAIQPDGRILVVGAARTNSQTDFALARYNINGSLDLTFGTGGKTTIDLGPIDSASAVALQPDGRIVVAGSTFSIRTINDFAVVRYESDGKLDETFGPGGKVITDFSNTNDLGTAVAIQPDGRIMVAGAADDPNGTAFDFALARYNADGSLDHRFGSGGKVTTDFVGGLDAASDVALQPDGRIVAAGFATFGRIPTGSDFAVARYEVNGALDRSFGAGGQVMTDIAGGFDSGSALAIQADGRLVVAGGTGLVQTSVDFALVRYAATGGPDFAISLDPVSAKVARGEKIAVRVNLNRLEGFTGNVTVTVPDADANGVRLNQDALLIDGSTAKFKLKIKASAPTGRHQLVFIGTRPSGQQRSTVLTLDVQ
ncbi:MAG TPA: delta-60 repeat domain-containing protein [Blastocatellia bacterium]|nr:delta-60 repeat domain-containing protein [Blastocatellia bacterium]